MKQLSKYQEISENHFVFTHHGKSLRSRAEFKKLDELVTCF